MEQLEKTINGEGTETADNTEFWIAQGRSVDVAFAGIEFFRTKTQQLGFFTTESDERILQSAGSWRPLRTGSTMPSIAGWAESLEHRLAPSAAPVAAEVAVIGHDTHQEVKEALSDDDHHGETDHKTQDAVFAELSDEDGHHAVVEHHEHHVHHDVNVHLHHGVLVIRSASLHEGRAAIHHEDGSELATGDFEHHGEIHIAVPREHGTYKLVLKDKEQKIVATVLINVQAQGVDVGEVEHEHGDHEHEHEKHEHEHEHEHDHAPHAKHDHVHEHEHDHEHKHDHFHDHPPHAHEDHIHGHSGFHKGHAHAAHDEAHEGHGHGHKHGHGHGEASHGHESHLPIWELEKIEKEEQERNKIELIEMPTPLRDIEMSRRMFEGTNPERDTLHPFPLDMHFASSDMGTRLSKMRFKKPSRGKKGFEDPNNPNNDNLDMDIED